MELLSLLIGTVILRPYVFIFLAIFFFVASQQIGWRRTLLWTITAYAVAFAAEYSSIHNGFPFGIYYYVETTRNQELWVAGVPFMDSLSWSFLTFTGYTCAWQLVAALERAGTANWMTLPTRPSADPPWFSSSGALITV